MLHGYPPTPLNHAVFAVLCCEDQGLASWTFPMTACKSPTRVLTTVPGA